MCTQASDSALLPSDDKYLLAAKTAWEFFFFHIKTIRLIILNDSEAPATLEKQMKSKPNWDLIEPDGFSLWRKPKTVTVIDEITESCLGLLPSPVNGFHFPGRAAICQPRSVPADAYIPAGGDYGWHARAWNNTEAAEWVRGKEKSHT